MATVSKEILQKIESERSKGSWLRVYVASIQEHGKRPLEVWKTMTPNNKTSILILAYVFEIFWNMCLEHFKSCPLCS